MPTSRFVPLNWLRQQLPCILCGIAKQQQHAVCLHCWQQLPWLKQTVIRHELEIMVACHYHYPLDRIIQKFKYQQQLHYQRLLAGCLSQLKLPRIQAIVPMPIATERLASRGFNQSILLAKILAKQLNVPVWQPIQRQSQHAQKGLSRLERIEDIENQFQIYHPQSIRYRRVLMLDDVVTTGSSLHALRIQLQSLGCEQIYACCVAAAEL